MTDGGRRLSLREAGRLPEAEPLFERIAIVGLGLIGGSLALAARQAWPKALVIGVDTNDVLERAVHLHAVDVGADDLVVAADADLVVLAAPVAANLKLLADLPEYLNRECIVTDVGASKRTIVEAARSLPARLRFIGGDPLAGAPRRGIESARADLFADRPWVLTPPDGASLSVARLSQFVRGVGGIPIEMTPEKHDQLAAYLNHLPQLVASALMRTVGAGIGADGLALTGKGLADMTRLAACPPEAWKDVFADNADNVGAAIDALLAALTALRGRLGDGVAIEELFDAAAIWRDQMPSRS
ncbi:MAG: prephenate dehydrogenase/arogenate dehydrogenase family protein [Acidobacteria bacterium]|nr:prephenate dehydrogenase/arogenate dehydrogenase family protein [Acidobacteriota bacterium]